MKPLRFLVVFSFWVLTPTAYADLYGFVDEKGAVHLANDKLDARYELFVKGETRTEFKEVEATPEFKLSSELKYLPATGRLEDHIIFKRLQKTPNVQKFEPLVRKHAQLQKLDPALVKAVIAVESAYDPAAISPKGATGLMQLIPGTAARYGVRKIVDPAENVNGGTRYLRDLLDMFNGSLPLALAGYNAGEGAVQRYKNTVPPFPETQAYVKLVLQFYEHFGGGAKKVTRTPEGRIRITLPAGRRNLPPDGYFAPGLPAPPRAVDAAVDPVARP